MPLTLPENLFLGLFLIMLFGVLSYLSQKIDGPGSLVGSLIALGIFLGGNFESLALLLVFFILGVMASSWKKKEKQALGLAQENEGKRSVRHAFSNGGPAAIFGVMAWGFPEVEGLFLLAIAGSLSTATADTLGSELGNVYGSQYVNVLNLRNDKKGKDGVISLEGTLLGLLGAAILCLIYGMLTTWSTSLWFIWLAGGLGSLIDSILGASLQKQGKLNNDSVNFWACLLGGLIAMLAYLI